jgi:hypothetical protein
MLGPGILVRSLAVATIEDQFGNVWQYHSRSDRHSKIACWGVMLDLLLTSTTLGRHVASGVVGFGINHTMFNFKSGKPKDLDLVICTPGTTEKPRRKKIPAFVDLMGKYGIELDADEQRALDSIPPFSCLPVGTVLVALEAKACMTAHVRALPSRLRKNSV